MLLRIQRGETIRSYIERSAFLSDRYVLGILTRASRYVFSTDTLDIEEVRPRTVSQELYQAEAKRWAGWHENQSKEEAEYPDG
ncbi:hypothetical protein [Pseudomonas cichorii]|uniref:hypothetical protein n=1 Tax=Pseudomonas cichorii TaxID=36746 RepID=UPI001C8A4FFD|nr:hypothetical protein [Pseudomonas cichorii]MBX8493296.1 hypothetical protein [Pseudomonas cichorii]